MLCELDDQITRPSLGSQEIHSIEITLQMLDLSGTDAKVDQSLLIPVVRNVQHLREGLLDRSQVRRPESVDRCLAPVVTPTIPNIPQFPGLTAQDSGFRTLVMRKQQWLLPHHHLV